MKKEMFRFHLVVVSLLIFISIFTPYPQTNQASGIKFNSQNVQKSEKTSIFLNEGNPIELENSFSISFDISFWDYKKFGPILRITDEQGNEIRVVYNQFKDNDTSYIQIIEPFQKNLINITLAKKDLLRNKWFNLKLLIERKTQNIKAYWNHEFVGEVPYSISNQENFSFVFGIKEIRNPMDFDVPAISVKNIIISENNRAKYFWELNPFKENPYVDKISKSKVKALNPVWFYQDNQKWKKVSDIIISDQSIAHLGVAFDSLKSRLLIDGRDRLIIHDLISGKDSIIKYKTTSPAYWNDLFYDYENQLLYSYFTALGKVFIYDLKKNEWIIKDASTNTEGHYFGSAKFSYPKGSDLYLLGGYGWYKTKNDLFKYDFIKKDWQKVKLKKNEMTPRAWFAFGNGFRDGEYLIYGGFGNESGDQEKGFKSNYDLLLLNMNDTTITKLKIPEQKFSYAMLFNNAYLDKEDSSFYFLSQMEEGKGISLSLNRLDLKTGEVIPIGNKFWKRSTNKWMYSYLHYNKATNEFISVIFDTTKVELFSINYPPISESQINYLEKSDVDENYSSILLMASAGFIFAASVLIYYRRKKVKQIGNGKVSSFALKEFDTPIVHFKNRVKLFGGLRIYDKEGKEISQTLSPKLKEIFLLILLRSINNHRTGITSDELSSIIWPDASPDSVKSNRGVAINKLRKIFSSVDGLDLEFSDKLWAVKMNNGSSCDYAEYLKFCSSNKNANASIKDPVVTLLNIVDGGEFLKGISYEWLDSIKFSINNEVIGFLKQYCVKEKTENDEETLLKLCDIILTFDPVDLDAIKVKIKTLSSQGKLHIAKSTYSLFVAEYKRLYDEPFPTSFDQMVTS